MSPVPVSAPGRSASHLGPDLSRPFLILGGGGHAAVVAEAIVLSGGEVLGYLDDAGGTAGPIFVPRCSGSGPDADRRRVTLETLPCLGTIAQLAQLPARLSRAFAVHAAAGDDELRSHWLELASDYPQPTIAHPSAVVSPSARFGPGGFLGPRAVVNPRARIGAGVIINTGAIVEHDCIVCDFCHLAPASALCGGVTLGPRCLVGVGASVRPNVRIGAGVTIGAGAAVVGDLPDGCTVVGVPARPIIRRNLAPASSANPTLEAISDPNSAKSGS